MSNHLDLMLQSANFQFTSDHEAASTAGFNFSRRFDDGAAMAAQKESTPVKAAFAHYPVEHGGDITGRWRPTWSDDAQSRA